MTRELIGAMVAAVTLGTAPATAQTFLADYDKLQGVQLETSVNAPFEQAHAQAKAQAALKHRLPNSISATGRTVGRENCQVSVNSVTVQPGAHVGQVVIMGERLNEVNVSCR